MTIVCIPVEIDLSDIGTDHIRREAQARGLLEPRDDEPPVGRCFNVDAFVDLDDIGDDDLLTEIAGRDLTDSLGYLHDLEDIKADLRTGRRHEALVTIERMLGCEFIGALTPS